MSEYRRGSRPDIDELADKLTVNQLRQWGEQFCWMITVITPVVCWLQGESVSKDQFIVRVSLLLLSASGGIAFRTAAFFRNRHSQQIDAPEQIQGEVATSPASQLPE